MTQGSEDERKLLNLNAAEANVVEIIGIRKDSVPRKGNRCGETKSYILAVIEPRILSIKSFFLAKTAKRCSFKAERNKSVLALSSSSSV